MSFNVIDFRLFTAAIVAVTLALSPLSAAAQDTGESDEIEALGEALQPYVMPPTGPFRPDKITIDNAQFIALWATSAHATATAEAFTHWNNEGEIPPACATCHSGAGFRDFYGLDGTEPGISHPVPTGGVVDCATCHNPSLAEVKEVTLPSGVVHPVNPVEAACLTCHTGREAGASVTRAVADMDDDTVNPELGFVNPHYALAGATWLGSYGGGGYQYPDKEYSGRFFHARPIESCVTCHNPHTLKISETTCLTCHEDGALDAIRISRISFDGSGDLSKGIRSDLAANADLLKAMLTEYSVAVTGTPLVFEPHYPYFFADADRDGRADTAEGGGSVAYKAWTPRLLKAAYNWKFVTADPGAFAHNPHYAFELLYDSIEDLTVAMDGDMASYGIHR